MELFNWGKNKAEDTKTRFNPEDAPVSETMIWFCEKCGFKLVREGEDSPARAVQKALKHIVSEKKQKRQIRSMVTSCMNVCPTGRMAAGLVDLKSGKARFLSFEYKGDVDQIAADLYRQI